MNDAKATATPQAVEHAGHKGWERLILGENSIAGTVRILLYIVAFVGIFGSLFAFLN
jgi:hypothetical protein